MTKEELKPVGTKAVVTNENSCFEVGTVVEVVSVDIDDSSQTYLFTDGVESWWLYNGQFEWLEDTKVTTSSGGPTKYYDMPFNDWVTGNDMMEYLAEHKWGKFGIHLKDIFKSTLRWGEKEGTTVEYDTRKIIYYGCRILRMIGGVEEVRKTLQGMLDDPQFSVTQEDTPSIDKVVTLEEPVAYDFDKMLDHGLVSFNSPAIFYKFIWSETPQGWDFWDKVDDGLVEESVWKPILADMEMQYEESNK